MKEVLVHFELAIEVLENLKPGTLVYKYNGSGIDMFYNNEIIRYVDSKVKMNDSGLELCRLAGINI